jgi:hypothetical protein
MQIADDVKGSLLRLAVVPQRSPDDLYLGDLLLVLELNARSKAIKTNSTESFSKQLLLTMDHMGAKRPVSSLRVSLDAQRFGQIENDPDCKAMLPSGKCDEAFSIIDRHVCRIDHREQSPSKAHFGHVVEEFKGIGAGALVGVIIRDPTAALVRRDDFVFQKMTFCERAFAATARADKQNES